MYVCAQAKKALPLACKETLVCPSIGRTSIVGQGEV